MTKITFIITGLSMGGAERMLFKVLSRLNREKFSPHVISLTSKGKIGPKIEALGIPVTALNMKPGRFSLTKFFSLILKIRSLKPDLVHTWMYHADLLGGVAARLAGIKNIAWCVRNTDFSVENNGRATFYVVNLCAKISSWVPKKILFCSHVSVKAHQEIGYDARKTCVIPNGFDLKNFSFEKSAAKKIRADLGLPLDTLLVGVIGRYHAHKNYLGFLEAASLVHKQNPKVHFLLIGQDVDSSNTELSQAIQGHELKEVVHLLGYREDTSYLLSALDVFALPSLAEAFPNVLGEAMACALPSVVTNSGDSATVLGEAGYVAEPTDMKGFATGLLKVLQLSKQDRDSLGNLARRRVEDCYNIEDIIRRYEYFYNSLIIS